MTVPTNKKQEEYIHSLEKEVEKLKKMNAELNQSHSQDNLDSLVSDRTFDLESNQILLGTVIAEAPIIIFSIDIDGKFTFSDGKALQLIGLAPGQVVGMSVYDVYKDYPDIIESVKRAFKGEEVHVTNILGGIHFDTTFSPLRYGEGSITGVVGMAVDMTDKVNYERKLQESNSLLQHAQQVSHMGAWEMHIETGETTWSDELFRIFGLEPGSVAPGKKQLLSYIHPADRGIAANDIKNAVNNKISYNTVLRLIRNSDNETVYVQSRGEIITDEEGIAVRLAGSLLDISERKLAELELKAAFELNDLIITNSPVGKLIYDETGKCIICNHKAASIFNASSDFLLKQNLHDLKLWKDTELYRLAADTLKSGENNQKLVHYKTDQSDQWIECFLSVFYRNDKKHLLFVVNDVSVRMKAQQERDRFFSTTLALLCTANLDGYFLDINPSWEKTLGYSTKELKNASFIEFVHDDDKEATLKEVEHLAKGNLTVGFTNRYRCKNGEYKYLNWKSVCYDDVIYASAIDISEIEEYKLTLEHQAEELKRSNEELEQFAYVASHDLQEPLRKIKNFTQMLGRNLEDRLDEKSRGYMNSVTNAVMRMQGLINDLLSYSRVSTQGKAFENTDLNEVLKEVTQILELRIEQTGTQLQIDPLPTIEADERQLIQLFQNFISNAIKFNDKEFPVIKVGIKDETPDNVTLFIQDNGIGIEKEYVEQIFTIFQRLHTRDQYEGTGIGLAICKKIVDRHKGQIEVVSAPGEETIFYIQLPKN